VVDAIVALLARRFRAKVVTSEPDDLRRIDPTLDIAACRARGSLEDRDAAGVPSRSLTPGTIEARTVRGLLEQTDLMMCGRATRRRL
jgi:hypothetical protein